MLAAPGGLQGLVARPSGAVVRRSGRRRRTTDPPSQTEPCTHHRTESIDDTRDACPRSSRSLRVRLVAAAAAAAATAAAAPSAAAVPGRHRHRDRGRHAHAADRPGRRRLLEDRAGHQGVLRLRQRERRRQRPQDHLQGHGRRLQPGQHPEGGARARAAGQGLRDPQRPRHARPTPACSTSSRPTGCRTSSSPRAAAAGTSRTSTRAPSASTPTTRSRARSSAPTSRRTSPARRSASSARTTTSAGTAWPAREDPRRGRRRGQADLRHQQPERRPADRRAQGGRLRGRHAGHRARLHRAVASAPPPSSASSRSGWSATSAPTTHPGQGCSATAAPLLEGLVGGQLPAARASTTPTRGSSCSRRSTPSTTASAVRRQHRLRHVGRLPVRPGAAGGRQGPDPRLDRADDQNGHASPAPGSSRCASPAPTTPATPALGWAGSRATSRSSSDRPTSPTTPTPRRPSTPARRSPRRPMRSRRRTDRRTNQPGRRGCQRRGAFALSAQSSLSACPDCPPRLSSA